MPENPALGHTQDHADSGLAMESLVGYILLGGVLLSVALTVSGLMWHWLSTGVLTLQYTISGTNLLQFLAQDLHRLGSGAARPRVLVNLGIATLLLTPYLRVFVSMVFFAFVERNWKYTLFTAFVFSALSYSLFLH